MPILDRRRPAQRRPERRAADDEDDAAAAGDLPEYEHLACHLTNEAKRAIAELSNGRDMHRYQSHIKESVKHLGNSVAAANDALRERHQEIRRLAARRAESDSGPLEKSQREEDVEAHVETVLGVRVPELTAEMEAAMRDLVDRQIRLDDDKAALADTVDFFQRLPPPPARGGRRRQNEDGEEGEDDEDEPPAPEQSVIDRLQQHREAKTREYERLNPYQRYALSNDYAAFKKLWHDAHHGDSGPPLPNAKRWFDDAGNPVLPRPFESQDAKDEAGGAGADDDEDEDLVIAGEVRDYRCPLSMQEYKHPYSNRMCNHTYEKQWIVEMLQKAPGRRAECVVAGCSKEFGLDDFYDDQLILRKMERAKEQERAQQEASSSADENDDEDQPRGVKREKRLQGSKRRRVETLDDDDDEGV
ncbi:hypothetical protein CPLU01_05479 [Colletotrichum plurivorum]|uniref:SP-RING-type domain-containing protein n=1 Tax=Colletotrichum plurivorum TaxID=2175906 RepID=A0A8H6KMC9_9PEZI|nr:hypothetical protein CPLU01_05479 [Colletotrichum plurivorum]